MSNTPTLPDADVAEPIPDEEYDDDAIGRPLPDGDGNGDLPESEPTEPLPSDVQPDVDNGGLSKPM